MNLIVNKRYFICCRDEGYEFSGEGIYTGVTENWGTENEKCTVHQFDTLHGKIFISEELDIIVEI